MAAPKYIHYKAECLQEALNRVAKLSGEIETWCDSKGVDGQDISYTYQLDNPYEFDLKGLHGALDTIADGNYPMYRPF